ncbi:MAG: alpha/beta hydrolase [Alphaproteobacteria bacterium]|nr:alpha/beta hydrolase [Alphaproteobacteria bacterium]
MANHQPIAAEPPIPEELWDLMARIGPRWGSDVGGNVRRMVEAYSEVLKASPKDGVAVTRDVAYGRHSRQRFDVFQPEGTGPGPYPALLFVHGGAFVEGHRNRTDEIYSNVLYFFARRGVVGVNIGYRLADDSSYPAASSDIASVVDWVRENAAEWRIDAARIYLMGHSAGGAHAASYAYDRRIHGDAGHGLAGLVIVSGRVRADNLPENPNARKVEAYYGTDPRRLDDCSPVSHVDANSPRTFIAFSEFENPLIDVYCLELAYRLAQARRKAPPVYFLKRHNHTSAIAHFNTSETALGEAILEFIHGR